MANTVQWCLRPVSILKWLQILVGIVIIILMTDGRVQWSAYTGIYLVVIVLAVLTSLTLLLYYFDVHRGSSTVPWVAFEVGFNTVAVVLLLICAGIGIYDCLKMYSGDWNHHSYTAPANIGRHGWKMRMAAVTALLLANATLYLVSAARTRRSGIA